MLHCTLHNLSNILCLSFEVTLAIQRFCIQHSTLAYATFKFSLSTFNFSNWTFTCWSASDGDRGLNWPDLPLLKWWSRVGRETFQWRGLGSRTWPIARIPLHSLWGRWVLSNRLSLLKMRQISASFHSAGTQALSITVLISPKLRLHPVRHEQESDHD